MEIMGRDARNYPREELRGKAAMVMQKAQLFGGTIRSKPAVGQQECHRCGPVGRTGNSTGCRVRQSQAPWAGRACGAGRSQPVRRTEAAPDHRPRPCGKPEILILDDSASALDYATDAALRKALAALPGSLTVFIVSQRAASLQHADQILVLDDGHLVGIGTHDQLRQTCPVYEEIYESQFKKGDAQK